MTQDERNKLRKELAVAVAPTFAAKYRTDLDQGHQHIVDCLVSFAETIIDELQHYEDRDDSFYTED